MNTYTGDFFAFTADTIADYTKAGRFDVVRNRKAALHSFGRFLGKDELAINEIDAPLMREFKAWLINQGRKEATAVLYLRQLNASYNMAVKQGLAEKREDMMQVAKSTVVPEKRPMLTMEELKRLRTFDFSHSEHLQLARDVFFFCIYTHGMSFIDMAYLRKTDLHGHVLTYTSRTSGNPTVSLHWDEAMQEIIDRHPSPTPYFFPFMDEKYAANERKAFSRLQQVREAVKLCFTELKRECRLSTEPSLYMARDLWRMLIDRVCLRDLL